MPIGDDLYDVHVVAGIGKVINVE